MKKWIYILGGCLIGFLVKKKADERNKPGPVRDWPARSQSEIGINHEES